MTYQVHERWDEEHLVTPALEAVERYVKPGIPFSKAMVDDAQTAIDAVLGIVGRGDTERMMRRFFWFVRHFFNFQAFPLIFFSQVMSQERDAFFKLSINSHPGCQGQNKGRKTVGQIK